MTLGFSKVLGQSPELVLSDLLFVQDTQRQGGRYRLKVGLCWTPHIHNVEVDQGTVSQLWRNLDESDPFCVISSPQDDRRTMRCKTQLRKSWAGDTSCAR